MRRFSGFLALIVLVAIGLGVVYYDRLWPDARRTEMPSAITAGTPEGPEDEASDTTPAVDTSAAPSSDGGKAAVVETPSSGQASADAMASAESQHDIESPVATETPAASADQTPGAPPAEEGVVAGAPSATSPDIAPEAVTPDVAETPALSPDAAVAPSASPAEPAIVTADPAPAIDTPADATAVAPEATTRAPDVTAPEVAAAPEVEPTPETPAAEAVVAEPPASPDEPATTVTAPDTAPEGETEVAIAPEVQSDTRDGATPPASESSGRDSMMQASPGPETAPAVSETEMAAIDPSAVIEPPQPTAAPEPLAPGTDSETAAVVPTFDVVRVESTGDAVVAGVAAPGATVELVDGASTVATAVASGTGDWAMALEEPLPPGQHDLSIRTTSKDDATVTLSDQRVAVLIPETAAEEPLVVLNTPDAPSAILQVPAAPEPPSVDVAAAEAPPPADAAASPSPVGEGAVPPAAAVAEASEPPPTAPEAAPEAGTDVATAEPATAEPPAAETDAAAAPATSEPAEPDSAAPAEPEVATLPPEAAPAEGPSAPAAGEAVTPEATTEPGSSPPDAAPEVAVAEPEPPVAPEPEPEPVVTPVVAVTAVEAETSGALFIAGTAITPEDVRVYVDDVLLGEVTPSPSGTWLLEVKRELPAGTYNVRADQVEPGAGTVLARAEVPFEREVEVAILRPVAEAGSATGAEATGTMAAPTTLIIKRSDNLWRISRELYGKGIRWSTIYQANKDQIRNPRWIYPGQVFILPQGDTEWPEEKDAAAN